MRTKELLDFSWRFYNADLSPKTTTERWAGSKGGAFDFGATKMDFDDTKWKTVNLPHDFVLDGNYKRVNEDFSYKNEIPAMEAIDSRLVLAGSLEGSIGWYRKRINVSKEDKGKRFYIFFDGVYRDSTVYLNHFFVGNHQSGFTGFYYDVTDFINYGKENLLAVRVDSTGHELWAYEGGGIYRHVWLVKVDPLHVKPLGGVFVTSTFEKDISSGKNIAKVEIATEIDNKYDNKVNFKLVSKIVDSAGNNVTEIQSCGEVEGWDDVAIHQKINISDAKLWSLEEPNLYKVISTIIHGDKEVDRYETTFGIRSMEFDKDKGFFLNGEAVKIKGVCCHQNHAGVGIAITDRINEFRLQKLKEMGCNAYRCSHNPPTPEVLDICDRLGILVMDENRILSSSKENIKQLKSLILRDRNHPSVFIWAIGNEEGSLQQTEEGGRIVGTLKSITRKLDPTRPVTVAIVFWDGVNKFEDVTTVFPTTKGLDVMGFNYHEHLWGKYHEAMPNQPTIGTETYSSMWTRGCYETDEEKCEVFGYDPKFKRLNEGEKQWKFTAENPWVSGTFIWTGFDYRGEPAPFTWPAIGTQFGVMDTCGFPKDNYYYFKSWWSNQDVLHLCPHWNWPDKVGKPIDVYCYSNCDEVELFVNGMSMGKKVMEKNWYLVWSGVEYQPGELFAIGTKDNKIVCEYKVETTDVPYKIELLPDREIIKADAVDVSIITVKVVDKRGRVIPTADNLIRFSIEGNGKLLGVGNGNPASHESDTMKVRRVFNGLCQLIVKADKNAGEIIITASSEQLLSCKLIVQTI